MKRLVVALILILSPGLAAAQDRDSYFPSYAAYDAFVNSHILTRDFIPVIQRLGGRDEYTPEQLNGINTRFHSIYPADFENAAVIRKTDLGSGFRQEARVFWGGQSGYLYFFAMLHDTPEALVVLTFNMNSDVSEIMSEF